MNNFWSSYHQDYYCCSVAQSCPTLCNRMDCSMPGLSVPHHLPKFAQVHAHCVGDATQLSHSLMSSYPSALYFSQHQGLFQQVSCSHQMTKIWESQLQQQSFQQVFSLFPWRLTGLLSLLSKGLSGDFSAPQFKGINSSALCLLYCPALTTVHDHWGDHSLDYNMDLCWQSIVSAFQHTV